MIQIQTSGRLGYLTQEQQEKLCEIWKLMLEIFRKRDCEALSSNSSHIDSDLLSPLDIATDSTEPMTPLTDPQTPLLEPPTPVSADANDYLKKEQSVVTIRQEKNSLLLGFMRKKKNSSQAVESIAVKEVVEITTEEVREAPKVDLITSILDTRDVFWSLVKADHPDALVLRFLRACKWNVSASLDMLLNTIEWRSNKRGIETLLAKGEEHYLIHNKELLDQIRIGKSFFYGTDKCRRPLCYVRVKLHKPKEQTYKTIEDFTIWIMEVGRLLLRPPVDTACIIFDLSDTTLINLDLTPIKFIVNCFQAHYPESLGCLLIYKAPWVFQGLWALIRGWLDPVVASKIHFVRSVSDLEKYIEGDQIIKELGGPNDWEYKYKEPKIGENFHMTDKESSKHLFDYQNHLNKEFEKLTDQLISSDINNIELLCARDEIAANMVKNYWKLDKFVRARTFYDRIGIIGENGEYRPFGHEENGFFTEYTSIPERRVIF